MLRLLIAAIEGEGERLGRQFDRRRSVVALRLGQPRAARPRVGGLPNGQQRAVDRRARRRSPQVSARPSAGPSGAGRPRRASGPRTSAVKPGSPPGVLAHLCRPRGTRPGRRRRDRRAGWPAPARSAWPRCWTGCPGRRGSGRRRPRTRARAPSAAWRAVPAGRGRRHRTAVLAPGQPDLADREPAERVRAAQEAGDVVLVRVRRDDHGQPAAGLRLDVVEAPVERPDVAGGCGRRSRPGRGAAPGR